MRGPNELGRLAHVGRPLEEEAGAALSHFHLGPGFRKKVSPDFCGKSGREVLSAWFVESQTKQHVDRSSYGRHKLAVKDELSACNESEVLRAYHITGRGWIPDVPSLVTGTVLVVPQILERTRVALATEQRSSALSTLTTGW
jgi:hypothetical protein